MAAEDGGVTDGRTNLIPNVVKDGSWHQHAGKHTEPSLFSLIAGLKGLAEVKSKRTHPRRPLPPSAEFCVSPVWRGQNGTHLQQLQ